MSFSSSGVRETFTLKRLSLVPKIVNVCYFLGEDPKRADQVPDDRELLEGISLSFAEAALFCEALRAPWLSTQIHRADVGRNAWHHPDRTGTTGYNSLS